MALSDQSAMSRVIIDWLKLMDKSLAVGNQSNGHYHHHHLAQWYRLHLGLPQRSDHAKEAKMTIALDEWASSLRLCDQAVNTKACKVTRRKVQDAIEDGSSEAKV
jgi:hypothetical protein